MKKYENQKHQDYSSQTLQVQSIINTKAKITFIKISIAKQRNHNIDIDNTKNNIIKLEDKILRSNIYV